MSLKQKAAAFTSKIDFKTPSAPQVQMNKPAFGLFKRGPTENEHSEIEKIIKSTDYPQSPHILP